MHTFSASTFLFLSTSSLVLSFPQLRSEAQPLAPSIRSCSSAAAEVNVANTCSGAAQKSVMWYTKRNDVSLNISSAVAEAVKAAGGTVVHEYTMNGFRGLAANAPPKLLDIVSQFGTQYGFRMEANCQVSIANGAPKAAKGGISASSGAGVIGAKGRIQRRDILAEEPKPCDGGSSPLTEADLPLACSGAPQRSVLWATPRNDVPQNVISLVNDAVAATGGTLLKEYSAAGFRGLAMVAPTKVLDLVELYGKQWEFNMRPNCKMASMS